MQGVLAAEAWLLLPLRVIDVCRLTSHACLSPRAHSLLSAGDDEAMARYKASLLGDATRAASGDPETRQVVIHEMRIASPGRPDLVIPLDSGE